MQTLARVNRSYWKVVLASGKTLSEQETKVDLRVGGLRTIDWTLDVIATGDILNVKELHLLFPNGGYTILTITEPGTAFQLKIASMYPLGGERRLQSQVIGRVDDKETGACTCAVWDDQMGFIPDFQDNVYNFGQHGMWRAGLLPLGQLNFDVVGLKL